MRTLYCLIAFALISCTSAFAQIEDTFDTNQFGWTESAGKRGSALIKDGVMHMESKGDASLTSTCYAPFDFNKPFVLSVDALAKKIDDDKIFGILLDYEDDSNFLLFYMREGEAILERFYEGRLVAVKRDKLKINSGKKVGLTIEVEYNLSELAFKVNDVKAMTYRRRLQKDESLLGTSGFGFFAKYGQVIDFDNLKIMQ